MEKYIEAKKSYAKIGVDTDRAIETLMSVPVALHCWQGDDVGGFDKKVDASAIESVIDAVIASNPQAIADYKAGKTKALMALFGSCMKELKGAADPAVIKELLENKVKNM